MDKEVNSESSIFPVKGYFFWFVRFKFKLFVYKRNLFDIAPIRVAMVDSIRPKQLEKASTPSGSCTVSKVRCPAL